MATAREVENVDVVVLGMGPGGESAAGELAAAGLAVHRHLKAGAVHAHLLRRA